MKDFKDYLEDNNIELEVDEGALSEAMWDFISSLDETTIENLDENQMADYIEIIEAVAGEEEDDDLAESKTLKGKKIKDKTDSAKLGKCIEDDGKAYVRIKMSNGDTTDVKRTDAEIIENDELSEIMPAKKVRRDVLQKRKASREHRKVKAKRKIEGRRKRKTATFKRFKKKAKRLGKRGLTATGKRKRTFINK